MFGMVKFKIPVLWQHCIYLQLAPLVFFFLNFCISIENNKNLACHLPTLPNSRSCEVTAVLFIWLQLLWPWQQWRDEDCEGIWGMAAVRSV